MEINERRLNCLLSFVLVCRLAGKVAVITGGASGIGACTARLFVKHGAKVIVADVQDELGRSVCHEIGPEETIFYVHCDVTCDSDMQNAVNTAVSKYGKLDIMFSNAGISGGQETRIVHSDDATFKRVLDVNVYGAFLAGKHAARVMIPAKRGCIIFTSSLASVVCGGAVHAYTASKHAVVGLSNNLCVELGQYGIRVNCISPFGVATGMFNLGTVGGKSIAEEVVSSSANLKGVTLKADDIAEAALYLGSDDSKYVSGINLAVDGGYSITNPSFLMALKSYLSSTHPPQN